MSLENVPHTRDLDGKYTHVICLVLVPSPEPVRSMSEEDEVRGEDDMKADH